MTILFITFHSSADRRVRFMRDMVKWKSRFEWIEMSVTNDYTTEDHLMVCLNGVPEYIDQYLIHPFLRFQAIFMYLAILEWVVFAVVLVVVVALSFIANQVVLPRIRAIPFAFWVGPLILYLQNISSNILSAEFYNISLPFMIESLLFKTERIETHSVIREGIELPTGYETRNLHLDLTDKEIIGLNLKFCPKFAMVGYIARFETAIAIIVFMYQKALAQREPRREHLEPHVTVVD